MAKVIFGNHSSVLVPRQDRDSIRKFYCDVLGGKIMKADPERDFVRLGENFYIGFLYGDVTDESEFLRSFRAIWLEIKSDNVDEMSRKILESSLVRKLDIPDPHLYFQAPGGQCLRLVGIDEDLSFYEGAGEGPNVGKVKEAIEKELNATQRTIHSDQDSGTMPSYTKTLLIQAPPRKLYEAVSTVRGLKGWWSDNTVADNGGITVRFSGKNFQTLRLLDPSPDKKATWEWIAQYFPLEGTTQTDEWVGTRVSFDIEASPDGSSTLVFTHIGLTPQLICYPMCNAGWNHFLESLRAYCETGRGTPYANT
jgi:uncharacterized protein YndB with AHSA1/START domain